MFERVRRSLLINSNASNKNLVLRGFSLNRSISMTLMKKLGSLKQFFFREVHRTISSQMNLNCIFVKKLNDYCLHQIYVAALT